MEEILFFIVSTIFLVLLFLLLYLKMELNKDYWRTQKRLFEILDELDESEREAEKKNGNDKTYIREI